MRRSLALPRDLERLLLYVDPLHGIVLRREGVVFTGTLQSHRGGNRACALPFDPTGVTSGGAVHTKPYRSSPGDANAVVRAAMAVVPADEPPWPSDNVPLCARRLVCAAISSVLPASLNVTLCAALAKRVEA